MHISRKIFSRPFFNNLKIIAERGLLPQPTFNLGEKGCIILPFSPHMFYYVHGYRMHVQYDIGYLSYEDIDMSNNFLYHVTNSVHFRCLAHLYRLKKIIIFMLYIHETQF